MPKIEKRHKIIPASYLILVKKGKILLARRRNTGFQDGNYGLVSGHGEKNETAKDTLRREAREEIGIDVPLKAMKFVHLLHRKSHHKGTVEERVDFFFSANSYKGIPMILEDRCDDLRWFSLDHLPKNTITYVRKAIECIRKKITYSEYGW